MPQKRRAFAGRHRPDRRHHWGAWEEAGSPVVTEELQAKLNKALEGLTGAGHENNYVIVTLYKALDGSAEITDVAKMPAQEW